MLTPVQAPVSANTNKTIAIDMPVASTVYYTVPEGRKFEGYFTSSSNSATLRISDVDALRLTSATTTQFTPPLITLHAGDAVSATIGTCALLGVESDI